MLLMLNMLPYMLMRSLKMHKEEHYNSILEHVGHELKMNLLQVILCFIEN